MGLLEAYLQSMGFESGLVGQLNERQPVSVQKDYNLKPYSADKKLFSN